MMNLPKGTSCAGLKSHFYSIYYATTDYIIGHSLKVQADVSYDTYAGRDPRIIPDNFNRWQLRFLREGLPKVCFRAFPRWY